MMTWLVCGASVADAPPPCPPTCFPTWDVVPRLAGADLSRFGALMASGHSGMLRIALIGDSQETSPGGAGLIYLPNINWRLFEHYGHAGETGLMSNRSTTGSPPADWLTMSAFVYPSGLPSVLPWAYWIPNAVYKRHRAKGAGLQAYGMIGLLAYDGSKTADPDLPVKPYFDIGHEVRAEIFAWTQPESGELSWQSLPAPTAAPGFFFPVTGGGVLEPGLSQPDLDVRSALTPPLTFGTNSYMQVEVWGTSAVFFTEVIGLRYVDATERRGAIVYSLGQGGAATYTMVSEHPGCGPVLRAMGFSAALLHFGANEATFMVGAQQFQADTAALVAWLREAMGDPHFPVILASDLFAKGVPPAQQAQNDQFPGALAELAEADPDILAVNLRRIVFEDLGWGPDDTSYLADGVHLNAYGQRALAAELVEELVALDSTRPSAADLEGDGDVDAGDLGALLASWGTDGPGDLDGDGQVTAADLGILLAAWTG